MSSRAAPPTCPNTIF
ncbi:rCG46678 [Rattus norvegicus]|uniref:RCG44234 n=1 Tax=Rattus norvegicus TaxID=10116 RepID=A6J781_RAT|nr:rCG44234 [Rattus norvegicus]EDM14686.1 rCG46678 [Rattus norvegicus]